MMTILIMSVVSAFVRNANVGGILDATLEIAR
jgi:hypothetical protein